MTQRCTYYYIIDINDLFKYTESHTFVSAQTSSGSWERLMKHSDRFNKRFDDRFYNTMVVAKQWGSKSSNFI